MNTYVCVYIYIYIYIHSMITYMYVYIYIYLYNNILAHDQQINIHKFRGNSRPAH